MPSSPTSDRLYLLSSFQPALTGAVPGKDRCLPRFSFAADTEFAIHWICNEADTVMQSNERQSVYVERPGGKVFETTQQRGKLFQPF